MRRLTFDEKKILQNNCAGHQSWDELCDLCPGGCKGCKRKWLLDLGWRDFEIDDAKADEWSWTTDKEFIDAQHVDPQTEYTVAKKIFDELLANVKFDGHTVSVWKYDVLKLAAKFGIIYPEETYPEDFDLETYKWATGQNS